MRAREARRRKHVGGEGQSRTGVVRTRPETRKIAQFGGECAINEGMVHRSGPHVAANRAVLQEVTDDHTIMTWSNFVFANFKRETTLAAVRKIQSTYDTHANSFPSGVYMVTIVDEGAPMPAADVRQALSNFLASGIGRTLMSAVIHEGAGFRAAAVRSVVTGLAMAARLPYPHKVFGTVADAASWFSASASQSVNAAMVADVVAEARQRALRDVDVAVPQRSVRRP
jgi:hypothetical protein